MAPVVLQSCVCGHGAKRTDVFSNRTVPPIGPAWLAPRPAASPMVQHGHEGNPSSSIAKALLGGVSGLGSSGLPASPGSPADVALLTSHSVTGDIFTYLMPDHESPGTREVLMAKHASNDQYSRQLGTLRPKNEPPHPQQPGGPEGAGGSLAFLGRPRGPQEAQKEPRRAQSLRSPLEPPGALHEPLRATITSIFVRDNAGTLPENTLDQLDHHWATGVHRKTPWTTAGPPTTPRSQRVTTRIPSSQRGAPLKRLIFKMPLSVSSVAGG